MPRTAPTMAKAPCAHRSLPRVATAAKKPPMAPKATPRAATVPTSTFGGTLTAGVAAAGDAPLLTTAVAAAVSFWLAAASASAARLAICSSTQRTKRLYGCQKAWRRLMGLTTILVMVAS